jgi:putative tryptophan/tyrosine transport system substrate-binding protein
MHNFYLRNVLTRSMSAVLILCAVVACNSGSSSPKPPTRVAVTQFVTHPGMDAVRQGFIDGMAQKGFVSGKTVTYDFSNANGDFPNTQAIGRRIAADRFDLVFSISTPSTQALLAASKEPHAPIIFGSITDPLGAGIVKSLDHPGDSITGTTDVWPYSAQLNLLQTLLPRARRLGVIYNPAESNSQSSIHYLRSAIEGRSLELVVVPVANSTEVPAAARSLVGRCDAIYIPADNTVISAIAAVVKIAEQNKLPLMPGDTSNIEIGGIGTVGHNYYDIGIVSGNMAARVLRGEQAGSIPVSTSLKEDLFFNLRSAKAMGVTIPQELLNKAVKVYDK